MTSRRRTSPVDTMPARFTEVGDRHAAIDDVAHSLEPHVGEGARTRCRGRAAEPASLAAQEALDPSTRRKRKRRTRHDETKRVHLLGVLSLLAAVTVVAPALAGHGSGQGDNDKLGNRDPRSISIALTGSEIPGRGDTGGEARAQLTLRPGQESVCFRIRWKRVDGVVTAAHIHKAPRGAVGPHHIELLNDESFVGRRNTVAACVQVEDGGHGSPTSAREKIQAVIESPEDYYLNVHSSAFPDGAILGQLGR